MEGNVLWLLKKKKNQIFAQWKPPRPGLEITAFNDNQKAFTVLFKIDFGQLHPYLQKAIEAFTSSPFKYSPKIIGLN